MNLFHRSRPFTLLLIVCLPLLGLFGAWGITPPTAVAAPALQTNNCFVEATGDNTTDYSSPDASAVQNAVNAATSGDTLKVAGTCAGVQTVSSETQTVYIDKNITIVGGYANGSWNAIPNPSANETVLDAGGNGRVVYISNNADVILSYLTLRNGDTVFASDPGGGIYVAANTGLLFEYGRIENSQADLGGAIVTYAPAIVHNSVITGNSASFGGGIYVSNTALTMTQSSLLGNQSTLSAGGGIYNEDSSIFIENSTFALNQAVGTGGAIYDGGVKTSFIRYNTISQNGGSAGGGIDTGNNTSLLANIIANNSGGDCAVDTSVTDVGYNLVGDGSCITAGTSFSGTAGLDILADHGGLPTSNGSAPETISLQFSSSARNLIPDGTADCGGPIETDQRGVYRLYDGGCDLGAYAYFNTPPVVAGDVYTIDEDTSLNVAASGLLANDSDVDGDPLSLVDVTPPVSGNLSFAADGSFSYVPSADDNGTVTMTYTMVDGGLPTVAYWNFDQGSGGLVQDESGNHHTAVVLGTANYPPLTPGPAVNFTNPYAYDFEAGGDVLTVADSNLINLGAQNERTVSFWIRPTDVNTNTRKQIIWEEGGLGNGLNAYIYDGSLYAGAWSDSNSWAGTWLSTTVSNNSWYHVALVLNSSSTSGATADSLFLYLNGSLVGTGAAAQLGTHIADIGVGDLVQDTRFHDGEVSGAGGHSYVGRLDELRIMNIAANDTEVDTLRQYRPGTYITGELTVVIEPVNDAPQATDNSYTTAEETAVSGNLITDDTGAGVDSDVENDSFELSDISGVSNGTISFMPDGSFTLTPTLNFVGNLNFTYQISETAANLNYALQFDGANDYVETASFSNGNAVTIEAWVRPDITSGNRHIYNGSGPPHLILELNNGKWRARGWSGSSNIAAIIGPNAVAGEWVHLAYVYDHVGNQSELFVNGVSAGTNNAPQPIAHTSQRKIGSRADGTASFFAGRIDEFRIWDEARTAGEIQSLMFGSLTTAQPNLLVSYPFDDGPGSGTASSVVNGYTGTLVNMDTATVWQSSYATGISEPAMVTVTVTAVPDPIIAVSDSYELAGNRVSTIPAPGVLANEIDVDGDSLQVTLATPPTNGTINLATGGGFVYTPTADYLGLDTFEYEVWDGVFTDTAVVTLTLNNPVVDISNSCGDVNALINGIQAVQAFSYRDTLQLPANCTYTLTTAYIADHEGLGGIGLPPVISDTLIIEGNGSTIVRDETAASFRFFSVDATGDLTLQKLTLQNGYMRGGDGALYDSQGGAGGGAAGMGGAIFNRGSLTLDQSTLLHNQAVGGNGGSTSIGSPSDEYGGGGGGMGGDAVDRNGGGLNGGTGNGGFGAGGAGAQSVAGRHGGFGGGGGGGKGWVSFGTPRGGNGGFGAGGGGGGQFQQFASGGSGGFAGGRGGNAVNGGGQGGAGGGGAGLGGAIFNYGGTVTIENSTLFSNTTQAGVIGLGRVGGSTAAQAYGGALFNHSGTVTLRYSTVAGNRGGGVYNYQTGSMVLQASIVADSTNGTDCINNSGSINVSQSLIESHASCGTPTVTADPQLKSLTYRDNYAPVLPLLAASPALDVIAPGTAVCGTTITADQWNNPRPTETGCDIGAYEAPLACFVSLNHSGVTDYQSADGSALRTAVGDAGPGDILRIAGTCAGVQMTNSMTQTVYIDKALTLSGGYTTTNWLTADPAAYPTVLDAQGNGRVVMIDNATVALDGLQIINGYGSNTLSDNGGGIYVNGTLTLTHSLVMSNTAEHDGGGIYKDNLSGYLTILNSQLRHNEALGTAFATGYGGAIHNRRGTHFLMQNSTIDSNIAKSSGGGLINYTPTTISRTTFSNNQVPTGSSGAIQNHASLSLINSTISGNMASFSGGISHSQGDMMITHSTIVSNTANDIGGISISIDHNPPLLMANSIVADNGPTNCGGTSGNLVSGGYNVETGNSCTLTATTDLTNTNPLLLPLADNGGSTWTHDLSPDSPALDAIPAGSCGALTDQRGLARPQNGACEMGAYEQWHIDIALTNGGETSWMDMSGCTYDLFVGTTPYFTPQDPPTYAGVSVSSQSIATHIGGVPNYFINRLMCPDVTAYSQETAEFTFAITPGD